MTNTETSTTPPFDHAADPFVSWVIDQITEGLHELCDGGAPGSEYAPFGSYARPESDGPNVLLIKPNSDAEDWTDDRRDSDEPWVIEFNLNEHGVPEAPAVRITVERIA